MVFNHGVFTFWELFLLLSLIFLHKIFRYLLCINQSLSIYMLYHFKQDIKVVPTVLLFLLLALSFNSIFRS